MIKLILLPGMDGSGKLFGPLIERVGTEFDVEVIPYPTDQSLSYSELRHLVQAVLPTAEPFVLMAESFSSPLAIQCAAQRPQNLKAVILCVGFVSSPVRGWRRFLYSRMAPILLKRTLPNFAIRFFLAGTNATPTLLTEIRSVISLVKPEVLVHRLRSVLTCDARTDLSRIDVPILYLQAAHDRLVGQSCLGVIRRANPGVIVEKIEGPHLLLRLEPVRVAEAVKAFIDRIPIN
jgi:pimeloyl-[acyl-carrier protein] methyl ester esterase